MITSKTPKARTQHQTSILPPLCITYNHVRPDHNPAVAHSRFIVPQTEASSNNTSKAAPHRGHQITSFDSVVEAPDNRIYSVTSAQLAESALIINTASSTQPQSSTPQSIQHNNANTSTSTSTSYTSKSPHTSSRFYSSTPWRHL